MLHGGVFVDLRLGDAKRSTGARLKKKATAAEEKSGENFTLLRFYFYTEESKESNGYQQGKGTTCPRVSHPKIGGTYLLTACAGFKETPRSCASFLTTFGHIKRRIARGLLRLTAGPPHHVPSERSAKRREHDSFLNYQLTFDWKSSIKRIRESSEETLCSSL